MGYVEMQQDAAAATPNVHHLVETAQLHELKKLLAENPSAVNKAERNTLKTPLHLACERGNIQMIDLLISMGANPTARDAHMLTPLFSAVKKNAVEVVNLLISKGFDPNVTAKHHETPLLW